MNHITNPRDSRFFYSVTAIIIVLVTFMGFNQFYLHGRAVGGRELREPIRHLLWLHGVGMSIWILMYLVQTLLISTRHPRQHRTLGQAAAALAALMVILGIYLTIESVKSSPPDFRIYHLVPSEFMAIQIVNLLMFAVLATTGMWQRRSPAIHRPFMLLAMLATTPAASSRIDIAILGRQPETLPDGLFGPFLGTVLLGGMLLLLKSVLTRSLDRWYLAGYVGLTAASIGTMQLATTGTWHYLASLLLA